MQVTTMFSTGSSLRVIKTLFRKVSTFSQLTNFRLFQTEKSLQTKLIIMAKFSKLVENTVGMEEIARYEQFLLFPQCLQNTCNRRHVKTRACLRKG